MSDLSQPVWIAALERRLACLRAHITAVIHNKPLEILKQPHIEKEVPIRADAIRIMDMESDKKSVAAALKAATEDWNERTQQLKQKASILRTSDANDVLDAIALAFVKERAESGPWYTHFRLTCNPATGEYSQQRVPPHEVTIGDILWAAKCHDDAAVREALAQRFPADVWSALTRL